MEPIRQSVLAYEHWLAAQCEVVPGGLAHKRVAMAADRFAFLRATCFRFAALFAALLPALAEARRVPSCGDAHTANFGTWRDAEGRLVWGVNDLDECAMLPFTADLVRLAASALLGPGPPPAGRAADAILAGYAARLPAPRGFVLDEEHVALRHFATPGRKARAAFWARIDLLPEAVPPPDWREALRAALPPGAAPPRHASRTAGLGSLGRPRYVAIAEWEGGRVVREAKSRIPSAWLMAGFPGAAAVDAGALAQAPGRVTDPWLRLHPRFVVRRLAPDSDRLLPPTTRRALLLQLEAMGGELANLHASGGEAHAVLQALRRLPPDWLRGGARRMARAVEADWAAFARG